MTLRHVRVVAAAVALSFAAGCAVTRGQESVGAYVNDAAITATVKARMVEDKAVDAGAIEVETLNGNVQLSGFARNSIEKSTAESIAMKVKGVKVGAEQRRRQALTGNDGGRARG